MRLIDREQRQRPPLCAQDVHEPATRLRRVSKSTARACKQLVPTLPQSQPLPLAHQLDARSSGVT